MYNLSNFDIKYTKLMEVKPSQDTATHSESFKQVSSNSARSLSSEIRVQLLESTQWGQLKHR